MSYSRYKNVSFLVLFLIILSVFIPGSIGLSVFNEPFETSDIPYEGYLKIYIVEPESRWNMFTDEPYKFGFLDYIKEDISIDFEETYSKDFTWNAQQAGYDNIMENNIMVMAVVFNEKSFVRHANPPYDNPFDAFFVDAAAGAVSGETVFNEATEGFTHTVFCEIGSLSGCQACPIAVNTLYSIFESYSFPFFFTSLIADKVEKADDRLDDEYNLHAYPTAFFDGGFEVVFGAFDEESYYIDFINNCGQRDVHQLNLSLFFEIQDEVLDINIEITNNEEINNLPPETPSIDGPESGLIDEEQTFRIVSTDPDDDEIYYQLQWDDGTADTITSSYPSGVSINVKHTWEKKGNYHIKVKAIDINGAESDWASLEVEMPKYKIFQRFIDQFFIELYLFFRNINKITL